MSTGKRLTRATTKRTYVEPDSSSSDEDAPKLKPKPVKPKVMKPVKRGKKVVDEQDASASEGIDEDGEFAEPRTKKNVARKPVSKKKKGSASNTKPGMPDPKWKNIRGKRGLLQEVADFPLDLLYEIFAYLLPIDILSLSRTTKDLRALLMTSSAVSVWKTARENLPELPPCPDDLNEAQYANLMFSNHCHHCLKPHTLHTIFWNSRTRACQECFNTHYEKLSMSAYSRRSAQRDITPHFDILPTDVFTDSVKYRKVGEVWWTANVAAINSTVAKKQEEGGDQAVQEWVRSRKDALLKLREHTKLCMAWHKQKFESREEERERLRLERQQGIFDRLEEAGWGDEIEAQRDWRGLEFLVHSKPFKDISRPVSERVWLNMKDGVIASLEENRTLRIADQLRTRWKARHRFVFEKIKASLDTVPLEIAPPPIANIVAYPSFRAILLDTPIDDDIPETALQETFAKDIHTISAEWLSSAKEGLLQHLKAYKKDDALTVEDLELASLGFKCSGCYRTEKHPEVLFHSCLSRNYRFVGQDMVDLGTLEVFERLHDLQQWSGSLVSNVYCQRNVENIIRACGLDPDTATQKMMDDLNPLLEAPSMDERENKRRGGYRSENEKKPRRSIFSWRGAKSADWRWEQEDQWVMLNTEDTAMALSQRKLYDRANYGYNSSHEKLLLRTLLCSHCDATFESPYPLDEHIRHTHGHQCAAGDWQFTPHLPWGHRLYVEPIEIILPDPVSEDAEIVEKTEGTETAVAQTAGQADEMDDMQSTST